MKSQLFCIMLFVSMSSCLYGQPTYNFGKGFSAQESDDMLVLNNAFMDTTVGQTFPDYLPGYRFVYRSASIGLDNTWDLWIRTDSVIVITLRGTTGDARSWLADFYCAMVPATGSLTLGGRDTLTYQLATAPNAAVHAGFLIGFAYLSQDILPKIDSLYAAGYRHVIVAGHSQGGALCYYVSAWLWQLEKEHRLPDLQIKTYASAAPKVGNSYFAYDYDNVTLSEWTFSITNSADVVPEWPFTTQQSETDMNGNPLDRLSERLDNLSLLPRIYLKGKLKKLRKNATKSSQAYQQILGHDLEKIVRKSLPNLQLPPYVNSTNFVRPGVPISLLTNPLYYEHFEPIKDGPYYHHGITPLPFLAQAILRRVARHKLNGYHNFLTAVRSSVTSMLFLITATGPSGSVA